VEDELFSMKTILREKERLFDKNRDASIGQGGMFVE
jgi:hypothetical protein